MGSWRSGWRRSGTYFRTFPTATALGNVFCTRRPNVVARVDHRTHAVHATFLSHADSTGARAPAYSAPSAAPSLVTPPSPPGSSSTESLSGANLASAIFL